MSAQMNVNDTEQIKLSKKGAVKEQDLLSTLNGVGEIRSSVETFVQEMSELSEYVEKTRELIEYAKIHILLKEKQAARILSVTPEELRQRRFHRREPRFFKIGDNVRYSFAVLLDYVARCEVLPILDQEKDRKLSKQTD